MNVLGEKFKMKIMLEHNKQIVFVRINPNIDLEVKARTFFWVLQIRSGIFAV